MEIHHYLERRKRILKLLPGKTYTVGRNPDRDFMLSDPSVSREHASVSWDHDSFLVRDEDSTNGTFVNGARVKTARLSSGDTVRFGKAEVVYKIKSPDANMREEMLSPSDTLILESKLKDIVKDLGNPGLERRFDEVMALLNAKKNDLADLAYRDSLTGLYNRRFFDESLVAEWSRLARYKRPLSLIMVDIDHFKRVNDTHGHQKGDSVLRAVGGIVMDNVRSSDQACRYGGEEMTVILPETPLDEAMRVAEKLRSFIETRVAEMEGFPVTASFGVSSWNETLISAADLVAAADSALYKAKEAGRNRVVRA